MEHVIDYIEFAVNDLQEAKTFYGAALGWKFTDYGPDYVGIQHPTKPGEEFGGMYPTPAPSRGEAILPLVRTDDADVALASVVAAGGRIRAELHDYPGGRRFTFADPSGNVVGVYQPSS